jgi:serine/threonine protein kinase
VIGSRQRLRKNKTRKHSRLLLSCLNSHPPSSHLERFGSAHQRDMNPIDDKATFTRPRFVSSGFHSQVILCNTRLSGRSADKPITCVLKCFPGRFQLFFENEIQAYKRLLQSKTSLKYPKPLGFAEWPTAKYIKTIGRTIEPLVDVDTESSIFVLVLQYVETLDVSSGSITIEVAVAAMESLNMLHNEGIVHGDISILNILTFENDAGETEVMWIDFSCSWIDASAKQIELEWRRGTEYFAKLVSVKQPSSDVRLTSKLRIYWLRYTNFQAA